VMDFGIAKAATLTALTTTGRIFGTPEYMSPEQAEGLEEPDARSDIYSLGVVVYEMFTGEVPFSGTAPLSVMRGHADKPPPRPSKVNPNVSPAVEAVLLKALAKKREARYQSAGEMAQALEEAIEARVRVTPTLPEPEVPIPPPVVKKPVVEEVPSPLEEPAAVAKEKPRPPTARPAPKAVPKKAPGWAVLLVGGLVSACVVGIIVVDRIGPWPTPTPGEPPVEQQLEGQRVEVINLMVEPDVIPPGGCAMLHWEVIPPGDWRVLLDGQEVPHIGEREVCPENTTPYELLVEAPGGPQVRTVTLHIEGAPPPEEPPPPEEGPPPEEPSP